MRKLTYDRRLTKLFAGLAIFAVLLASLAPSVSRIWLGQTIPTPNMVEVCTVEGMQMLPADTFGSGVASGPSQESDTFAFDTSGADPHAGGHQDHCPFCLTHACSFGLAPVASASLPSVAMPGDYLPAHALSAPHAQFAWLPSQARAPPFSL